jgi:subtilisin family serine protease
MPSALRRVLPCLLFAGLLASAAADEIKVWVVLADKGPGWPPSASGASPAARRAYENAPLHAPYLKSLTAAGFAPDAGLKWQNRVSGRIAASRVPALRALPFVAAVEAMPRRTRRLPPVPRRPWPRSLAKRAADIDYGHAGALYDSVGISRIHRWMAGQGMAPGQGMRIAIIDADFHLGNAIFAALKPRILDQWDFAARKPQAVDDLLLDSHGAECLSLIGGNAPGTLVGGAPDAAFLLYRAEIDENELYAEEDHVAAAIERAVDSGAQVINISLGYRYDFDSEPDIPYAEMNGRTRPATLAALGAARRNVLISAAMGNDGDAHPQESSLSTPADADSILAVGIVDPDRFRCGYSSTGPTADGRVKPELVSLGLFPGCTVAVAYPDTAPAMAVAYSGTSFAAPVAAAAAALLRQLRPQASAEQVRQALMRTASHADHPDNGTGYGVLDAAAAALSLGVPLGIVLVDTGRSRLFHPGGRGPVFLAWDPGSPLPRLELVDLTGRRVPVAVKRSGSVLALRPERRMPSGVYLAHIP